MKSISANSRIISVDLIRIVAMLMVISLHTILNFTLRPDFFATKLWFILEPVIAISKTSVLLFFMLSGYLVLSKSRNIQENWQKTQKRILVPLLFFSVINLFFEYYKFNFTHATFFDFLQAQLVRITNFPSSPLWFLVVLLVLYLLNPIWQLLFADEKKPDLALYLIKVTFLFAILSTLLKFPSLRNTTFYNNFTGWIGFVFFYLYGGALFRKWIRPLSNKLNWILFGLGLIATIVGDYYTSYAAIHSIHFIWSGYFFEYQSIPITLMAVSLFNILISYKYEFLSVSKFGQLAKPWISWLAGLSFGIYLIHSYIVTVLLQVGFDFNKMSMNVYVYNFLNYAIVFFISLLITLGIKQIPKLRWILGE